MTTNKIMKSTLTYFVEDYLKAYSSQYRELYIHGGCIDKMLNLEGKIELLITFVKYFNLDIDISIYYLYY